MCRVDVLGRVVQKETRRPGGDAHRRRRASVVDGIAGMAHRLTGAVVRPAEVAGIVLVQALPR